MINSDAEIALDYLLSPEFELINSAGKPLTGGYIEVYIHGTRNKYYCYSDWAGTLHPFQIPLDSLGSNIILASPDNAYDVYVYNKYGSLIMSRYNVHCQGTGGGGGSYAGDKLFYGQYTAHNVAEIASLSKTKGNINLDSDGYLQLKQGMSYHITVRGAFQVDDVTNTETTLNYIEYSTISPIKVDVDFTKADPQNFELSYDIYDLAEDMAYQVAFEQINGMVTDLVIEVHSLSNLATTATFNYEAGDYISIVDNTISVTGINPEDYSTHSETYESIVTAIELVTGIVPDDAATHGEVYEATVTAINFVTGIIPETQVQSDWDQTDDTAVDYIKNKPEEEEVEFEEIDLNDYALASAIPDVSDFTTHNEVNESITTAINFVTGAIPTPEQELPLVAGDGITITEYEDRVEIAANVTSIDGYATESFVTGYVEQAISEIPEQQQADWDQTDDTAVDYIKNKPDLDIYATHDEVTSAVTSIDLSNYATNTEVYEATVTAVQVATGAIPEEEEVEFEEIDLNDYALASAIPDVSDFTTHNEVYEATVTAVQFATGAIPDVSDYATHTEVYDTAVTAIQLVTGLIPDVSDFTTHTEVYEATVTAIESATAVIPDTEEVEFEEINLSDYALASAIPDVSNYATHDEVHESIVTAMEYVTGIIPEAQVQSNWTETDNEDPSYIQNKPDELPLVAGDGITITEDLDHITIAANVTSIDGYATIEEVNTVSSVLHEEIQNIPEQVQSDWDQTNVTAVDYIKNKPDEEEVEFEEVNLGDYALASAIPEYTAGDYINIDNYEINVTGLQPEGDYATQTDLIEAVSAVTGIGDYGQFYSTNITGAATMSRTKGTIEVTNDGKIKLKKGQSYHVTVRGVYNQTSPTNIYGDVSYIEYITGQSIHVNVDKSITDSQYFEISYDLYKLSNDSDYYVFLSMNGGTVNDLFIEIHAIGSVGVGGSGGGGGTEYDAGWGIQILNNVISVNPSIIPVVTGFATKEELQDGLELVTGLIPEAQVQSDWTEADTDDPAYILNKPSEKSLVAGDGISITVNGTDVIISASVTGTPIVTGYVTDEQLQDAVELVTGLIPDTSDLATKAELQDGLEVVTGLIPNYTSGDYISIENNEISVTGTEDLTMKNLTAGEGITITESGDNIVISASVTGTPVVTGYVTDEELQDAVELVTGLIPTDYATPEDIQDAIEVVTGLIPDTSNLATKAELQDGLEVVTGLIPTVQLNGSDQVTAINNYPLAEGGSASYTAGDNIDITNDVISVTGTEDLTLMNLTAGEGISIETSATGVVINTTEIVSGLQLIAGDNIIMTVSGNNLVISAAKGLDETVLYTASSASDSITTTEEVTNFERLRIELQSAQSTYVKNCLECKPDANNLVYTGTALIPAATYPLQMAGVRYTSSDARNFTFSSGTRMCYKVNGTYGDASTTTLANSDIKDVGFITKIVGINRISS